MRGVGGRTPGIAGEVGRVAERGTRRNMHFQDEIVDGQMRFDFTLREDVAMKSNGVELMRLIGLNV